MTISFTGKSFIYAIVLCIFIFILCLSYEYIMAPSTYEDCVLTHLKGNENNYTANFIDDMCSDKFKNSIQQDSFFQLIVGKPALGPTLSAL